MNLRVEPLVRGLGDPMIEVRQDVVQVPVDHPRQFHQRFQARIRRPEVPVFPMPQRPAPVPIVPQEDRATRGRDPSADSKTGEGGRTPPLDIPELAKHR